MAIRIPPPAPFPHGTMSGMKTLRLRLAILICLLLLPASFTVGTAAQTIEERCAEYATQADAQAAFDADPDGKRDLDDDNDGIACEHLPTGVVTDSGPGILPWIAAGVIVVGAGAGAIILRRFTGCSVPYRQPPAAAATAAPPRDTGDETAVEIDLAALKAERDRETRGKTPGQGT